jgi:hypothetical protein
MYKLCFISCDCIVFLKENSSNLIDTCVSRVLELKLLLGVCVARYFFELASLYSCGSSARESKQI